MVSRRQGGGEWWNLANGQLHRVDGPAMQHGGGVAGGGSEHWIRHDRWDRVDGPAWRSGLDEMWYRNDVLHRYSEDGPAVRRCGGLAARGDIEYWVHGMLHSDPADGPAVLRRGGPELGGYAEYVVHGLTHSDPADGPAVQHDGVLAGGAASTNTGFWVCAFRRLIRCRRPVDGSAVRVVAAPSGDELAACPSCLREPLGGRRR